MNDAGDGPSREDLLAAGRVLNALTPREREIIVMLHVELRSDEYVQRTLGVTAEELRAARHKAFRLWADFRRPR